MLHKILIVDDQDDNLKSYKTSIEDSGLNVSILTAKNEKEAKKSITKQDIDVIVTDLVMLNDQSGMDVLRIAKEKDPLIMVIIITAYDDKLTRYKAFEIGAFDCITKSTPGLKSGEEIVVKVRNALNFRNLALEQIKSRKKMAFLKRYFDPKVFSKIEKDPELINIRNKHLTIVFWDIRGFSKLCEDLKVHPDLIAGFLKEYFDVAANVIFKHQGVLDKFIGDGVMALFGALNGKDEESKQDAVDAVNAALEFKSEFDKLLKEWMEKWTLYTPHKIEISLGCGIHTGEALVGNVETKIRDQFTALGSNVNFAQRIESNAQKDQILISQTTKSRVHKKFDLKKIDTLDNIKNIAGSFDIFEVIKARK